MFGRQKIRRERVDVENVVGRLGRLLATPGPDDHRMRHHRTHDGNTDPSRVGLALVARRPVETGAREPLAGVLDRILAVGRGKHRPTAQTALAAAKQAARD